MKELFKSRLFSLPELAILSDVDSVMSDFLNSGVRPTVDQVSQRIDGSSSAADIRRNHLLCDAGLWAGLVDWSLQPSTPATAVHGCGELVVLGVDLIPWSTDVCRGSGWSLWGVDRFGYPHSQSAYEAASRMPVRVCVVTRPGMRHPSPSSRLKRILSARLARNEMSDLWNKTWSVRRVGRRALNRVATSMRVAAERVHKTLDLRIVEATTDPDLAELVRLQREIALYMSGQTRQSQHADGTTTESGVTT